MAEIPKAACFVAYHRASAVQQGHSGLGLEATPNAVRAFLAGRAGDPAKVFTEIESGKNTHRLQVAPALNACRLTAVILTTRGIRTSRIPAV